MKRLLSFVMAVSISLISLTPVFAENNNLNTNQKEKGMIQIEPMRLQYGVITGDNVRLRETPGLSGTVIMYLHTGYEVTVYYTSPVYKDGYEWREISYNGVGGWVAANYLHVDG